MLDTMLKALPLIVVLGGTIAWVVDKQTGWLSNAAQKAANERAETRAVLSDEFARLRAMNDALIVRMDRLVPDLENLREEYFQAVQREISLIDEVRRLKAHTAANSVYLSQMARAIHEQNEHIIKLRQNIVEAGLPLPPSPDIDSILAGIPDIDHWNLPLQRNNEQNENPD